MKGINKKYKKGLMLQILRGWIILPPQLEGDARSRYVQKCYRTGRVSILIDGGGVSHDVPVDKLVLKEVAFPEKFGEAGDSVLCWLDPFNGKPQIFALYNSEDVSELLEEHEYKIVRSSGGNVAEIDLKGQTGEIYLNVDSSEDDGGNLVINVNNANRNGKLKINVFGESSIYTSNKCSISSNNEIELRVKDIETEKESKISVNGEKIVFNDGVLESNITDINKLVEKINVLEDDLNTIKEAFTNWIPVASDGGAALKTIASEWFADTIVLTDKEDIEDPKIEN